MSDALAPGGNGFLGPVSGGGGGGVDSFIAEEVTNSSGSALAVGEIVRISADDAVTRAQANVLANLRGTVGTIVIGAANGSLVTVATEGKAIVLLEPALVPTAGDTLYVSAATAGRATNIAPVNIMLIGVIKDASQYAIDGTVVADVDINSVVGGGGSQGGIVTFGSDSIAAAADTRYLTQGFDSVTAAPGVLEFPAPRAGTFRNMFVRWNNAPGGANANAVSVRLRVNGVDSALTVSRAANAGVGQTSNVAAAVAVAQGDRIAVVAVKALAIGSGLLNPYVSMEFV